MIPIGYMAKHIVSKPDWLKTDAVECIISVSNCISKDFTDWIDYWAHNGYWFFNSPEIITSLAAEHDIDLSQTRWFYYEAYEKQFDEKSRMWKDFKPQEDFLTKITSPKNKEFLGYDIATFHCGTSVECSPLSCNHVADEVDINGDCLLDSLEEAIKVLESDVFQGIEPGPYRILSVFEVPPPSLCKTSVSHQPFRKALLRMFSRR